MNFFLNSLIIKFNLNSPIFTNKLNLNFKNNFFLNSFFPIFQNNFKLNLIYSTFKNFLSSTIYQSSNLIILRQEYSNEIINLLNVNFFNINGNNFGSAIYAINTNLSINLCQFLNCTSIQLGGAIYLKNGLLLLSKSCFLYINCLSTADPTGRCFYIEYSSLINLNLIYFFQSSYHLETSGDSTFCISNSYSIISNYNISYCYGRNGMASGEFKNPISNSLVQYGQIEHNKEFCAFGSWGTLMIGKFMNFINMPSLTNMLAYPAAEFHLYDSLIWNCLRILGESTTNYIQFFNCKSDYNYRTGISVISTLSLINFSNIQCNFYLKTNLNIKFSIKFINFLFLII